MTTTRTVTSLGIIALFAFVFLSLGIAKSQDLKKGSAEWYCHEGAVLLHAGHGYKEDSSPFEWTFKLLDKARDNFNQCIVIAQNADDESTVLTGVRGFNIATMDMGVQAEFLAVRVYLFKDPTPQKTFNSFHQVALTFSRIAISNLMKTKGYLSDHYDVTDSSVSQAMDRLNEDLSRANDIKAKFLAINFSGIPRNQAEWVAFIDADRFPLYSFNRNWGLTAEERCTTPDTLVSVEANNDQDETGNETSAKVQVDVSSDGSIRAVHLVNSSGSQDHDEVALKSAYGFKYKAATHKCKAVDGSVVLSL